MQYTGLAVLAGFLALLLFYLTLRLGWRLEWLLGWVKGSVLILLLGGGMLIAGLAWELSQFRPITDAARVVSVEFRGISNHRYEAEVNSSKGVQRIPLEGHIWELDVQVLRWRGLPGMLGLDDGYRLNSLGGRYLTLEQQQEMGSASPRVLHATPEWRGIWHWLDRFELSWVYADVFVVRFMPMADGARYAVEIGTTGLSPVALNRQALDAMESLQ